MLIYPAIDLIDGRCVRLRQGRFEQPTVYSADPAAALDGFSAAGAEWAHVVDLDGARAGAPRQHGMITALVGAGPALQVAGGVRSRDHVATLLDAGAARVVIGSLAIEQPALFEALLVEFGADRIVLALDVRCEDGTPRVATRGWQQDGGVDLWSVAARYPALCHLLVTDIARDGMLAGPNLALMAEIAARLPQLALQASGGVAALADLAALRTAGAAGAIVGKALWEERLTLAEAIDAGR